MYCPNCGKELPKGSNFCPSCGNSINSPAAQPQPQPQTTSSSDQDIPSTEQQNTPPVPDEKVICPKCGATGCTPQYKQNISGGGYGCLQGGLGALILGPFGLLCGMCGRSVKTTNNLVWICPKCGHEFRPVPHIYERSILGFLITGFMIAVTEIWLGTGSTILFLLFGIGVNAYSLYSYIHMFPFMYTDEQKETLKKCAIVSVVIMVVGFLIALT